jgi:hypothetical protein
MTSFSLVRLATVVPIGLYLAALVLPWAAMNLGFVPPCPSCYVHMAYAKVYLVQLVGSMLLSPARTDSFCALTLGIALTLGTVQIVNVIACAISPIRSSFFFVASSFLVATCLACLRNCLESPRLGWAAAFAGSLALMVTGGAQGLVVWRERRTHDRERVCGTSRLTVLWQDQWGRSVPGILIGHEGSLQVRRGADTCVWFPERAKIEYGSPHMRRREVFWSVGGRSVLGGLAVVAVVVWAMLDMTSPRNTTPLSTPGESLAFAGVVLLVAVTVAAILLFLEAKLLAKTYRVTVAAPDGEQFGSFVIERWQLESLLDVAARAQMTTSARDGDDPPAEFGTRGMFA